MPSPRRRPRFARVAAILAALVVIGLAARAPADVQEQRNRLPPPAMECADPVEGVWMSHVWSPPHGEWYIVTLTMRRKEAGSRELVGSMLVEFWDGVPENPNPPPCEPGGFHVRVMQEAVGLADGWNVRMDSINWRHDATLCGSRGYSYALDHHAGRIDPQLMEFQSLNNDGALAVNEPHVFRRIRCIDPARPPRPTVRPPPFHPPGMAASGCGCRIAGR